MESAHIDINSNCADDNVSSCVGSEIKVHEPKPITTANVNELECHKVAFKGDDFNFGRIGEKISNYDMVWKYSFRSYIFSTVDILRICHSGGS